MVDLFIDLVARINTRAERRVEKQMIAEFRRVGNKESVLFRMADAAVEHPDETVRAAVYPVVGEATLRDLVAEAKATEASRRARVRTVLTGSYSSYYRRMLPELLAALGFRCNNTAYRPVMQAVELLERYKDRNGRLTQYDQADRVPLLGVVKADWRDAVVDEKGRVTRTPDELCALGALREAIRRREIWVEGAGRWRNPDTDLPHDFDLNRDVQYTAIRQPDDPTVFVDALRERLDTALARCAEAIRTGTAAGVRVGTRKGQVWITVPRPFLVRGCGDDGWPDPARRRRRRSQIEANYTVTHGAGVVGFAFTHLLGYRLLPPAEEHRRRPALPARRRRELSRAGDGAQQADQVGPGRPAVRPDDQVRAGSAAGHRRGRADSRPVPPRRPEAPDLRR